MNEERAHGLRVLTHGGPGWITCRMIQKVGGERIHGLRALTSVPEDLSSVPSTPLG